MGFCFSLSVLRSLRFLLFIYSAIFLIAKTDKITVATTIITAIVQNIMAEMLSKAVKIVSNISGRFISNESAYIRSNEHVPIRTPNPTKNARAISICFLVKQTMITMHAIRNNINIGRKCIIRFFPVPFTPYMVLNVKNKTKTRQKYAFFYAF